MENLELLAASLVPGLWEALRKYILGGESQNGIQTTARKQKQIHLFI